jgi:hypothetical protein
MELLDRVKVAAIVMVLSFLFSPGLLLTLPPKKMSQSGLLGLGVLNSKETHILSMFVHSIVIAGLLMLLLSFAPYLKDICGSPAEVVEVAEVAEVAEGGN